MSEFLDRPVYFLGRFHPGVLDPALLRIEGKRVALFFTAEKRARAHLSRLPKNITGTITVQCAADYRAKEELFGAALAQGALELWLDAAPGGEPVLTYPLGKARDYILSFKRQSACL